MRSVRELLGNGRAGEVEVGVEVVRVFEGRNGLDQGTYFANIYLPKYYHI